VSADVRPCSMDLQEERETCAALMQLLREGKIDAVMGANSESGVLRLLDAKLVDRNEQLLQQLECSNAEIKQFTYAMTHDLQTPLVSLTGAARVLRMHLGTLNDEHIERWLRCIETAADRMVAMLDDLMIYAKSGGEEVECSVLSLHEILESVFEELRPLALQKGIQFHLEPTTASVLAEPKALHRVFVNLMGNAIKYMERKSGGEVKATVSEHQGIVRVRITDNGPGIPSEHLSNVFRVRCETRFWIGAVDRQTIRGGVWRPCVAGIGWSQRNHSDRGVGGLREGRLNTVRERSGMKGKRILIAHFDRMQVAALAATLVEEEYDVVTAEDVVQAVASLREDSPNLVLTTFRLPGGGGIRVHEQLNRTGHLAIPVIYLSDQEAETLRAQAQSLGARPLCRHTRHRRSC